MKIENKLTFYVTFHLYHVFLACAAQATIVNEGTVNPLLACVPE